MNSTPTAPRVRFAPSPTGYLHVGGARTALFNYLFARSRGGSFLLRIEDTDRARSSDAMTAQILSALDWLGLEVDEPPVHQADGLEEHRAAVERLVASGSAYHSFLSADELGEERRKARERGVAVRRAAIGVSAEEAERRIAGGEAGAVFFAVPPNGETSWDDAVHGPTGVDNASIDDFVVLRSDDTPVYNLAVVADDIGMAITHVIRGDDHLSNTPKQVLIYRALDAEQPVFCHVPMILGPDGKRLSKRHGATSVEAYRDEGILPEALVNFLALLGWSPGDDREFMTMDELAEAFSLDRILKKASVFDAEKLEWLNGQHLAARPVERLAPLLVERLDEPARSLATASPERLGAVVEALRPRSRTIAAMAEQAAPFFTPAASLTFDEAAMRKHWAHEATGARLAAVRDRLAEAEFRGEVLEAELRDLAEQLEIGAGKLFQPLRLALMGTDRSPGIFDVLVLLGRTSALERLDRALGVIEARSVSG